MVRGPASRSHRSVDFAANAALTQVLCNQQCSKECARIRPCAPSTRTASASGLLEEIRCGANTVGGFGHPGGNLAGSAEVLGAEDGSELGDQRFAGGGREAPGRADLQPLDLE